MDQNHPRFRRKKEQKPVMRYITYSLYFLLAYFLYHTISGDRGILAWLQIRKDVSQTQEILKDRQAEKDKLEKKVQLLRPDHLDLDMLDERAREVLGYAHPEDVILLPEDPKSPKSSAAPQNN